LSKTLGIAEEMLQLPPEPEPDLEVSETQTKRTTTTTEETHDDST